MSGIAAMPLSNAQTTTILTQLLKRLRIVLTCPARVPVGAPISAKLIPNDLDLDASDLVNGTIDLAAIAKDLLFDTVAPLNSADPALSNPSNFVGDELLRSVSSTVLGGSPFTQQTQTFGLAASIPAPVASSNIVKGLSAQLLGTLSWPNLKAQLTLKWVLYDDAGNKLSEDHDFASVNGSTSPTFEALLIPRLFREYRADTLLNPGGSVICVTLEATLKLGSMSVTVTLGPLPVIQLPLLIPTVVGLFTERNFDLTQDSAVLLVVPEHFPLTSAQSVISLLRQLEKATSALRGVGGMAAWFLGLDDLLDIIPQQPRLRFAAKNSISDLEDYLIKSRPWYNPFADDRTFDDQINSIFILGMPGVRVHFFNDENFEPPATSDQGNYTVALSNYVSGSLSTPDFVVVIRDLKTTNSNPPVTAPPGRITQYDLDTTGDGTWDTDLTSLRFDGSYIQIVDAEVAAPTVTVPMVCHFKAPDPVWHKPDPSRGKSNDGRK